MVRDANLCDTVNRDAKLRARVTPSRVTIHRVMPHRVTLQRGSHK